MQTGAGDGIMSISAVPAGNSCSSSRFSFSEALFMACVYTDSLKDSAYRSIILKDSLTVMHFCKKERVYG